MKITDFYDDLMPRLPGADESLIEHETFAAIRKLCEEGWAWTITLTMSVRKGQKRVYLDPMPENTKVGYILSASLGTRTMTPLVALPLNEDEGSPMSFYMEDTGTMRLNPIPDKDYPDGLTITATVIPMNKKVTIPDMFNTHYRDTVIDAVCHRMMIMSSKPWTNPSMGVHHGKSMKSGIKRIRDITNRRYGMGDNTWSFPRGFR